MNDPALEVLGAKNERHKCRTLTSAAEAHALRLELTSAAERTLAWMREFEGDSIAFLTSLKFEAVGHDPLSEKRLNIIEQINQTFTIAASLRAVENLFELHPDAEGFKLALATEAGRDILSVVPGVVAAEVFAATHPRSNNKLKKDTERLVSDRARHRYVFFLSPNYRAGRQPSLETVEGIQVHAVQAWPLSSA